ncbi:MAG: MFS transporter [Promethearchaeota archaeon]
MNAETKKRFSNISLSLTILLFFLILMFGYADQNMLSPLLNTLLLEFFNNTQNVTPMGWITFTFTILSAISMIIAGILADITTRKKICFAASIIYGFFSILTYFTPIGNSGYIFYFITRALNGIGMGAIVPTIFSLMGDLVPADKRSTYFGYITMSMLIGQMFGISLASSLTHSWRIAYLFMGSVNLVLAFCLLLIKEPKRGMQERELQQLILEGAEYRFKWKKGDLRKIWSNKSNFWLIINFIDTFPGSIIIFLIFKYMEDIHNVHEEVVNVMIIFVAIFGVIGIYLFGRLGDMFFKKNPRAKVQIALFCNIFPIIFVFIFLNLDFYLPSGLSFSEIISNPYVLTLIAMITIAMFINQGVGPNWYSSLTDINLPEHRGTMISFASFMDLIGRSLGPLIASYIATIWGISAGMWSSIIFWFINVAFWIPVFFTIKGDLDNIHLTLEKRAEEMKKNIQ